MSDDYVIDAFGARWSLEAGDLDPAERDRLHVLWEACRVPGARSDDDGVEPFEVRHADPYAVSRAITLASIKRRMGEAVLLHAAGFSDGDGDGDGENTRAIAFVGPSGTGKSTAARTLGQHFGYLSDETVAIESDDRISPYPKPVSTIVDPGARWEKEEHSPTELGLREAGGTAYLHAVVVLDRDPRHEVPELTELPLVDAVLAVTKESSSLPLLERPMQRIAQVVSAGGGPYVLRYSEIGECVDLVRSLFDREGGATSERAEWATTEGTTGAPPPSPGSSEFGADPLDAAMVVERAPWRDALHGEGGSIVLIGSDLLRLGPVGEVVWQQAADPVRVGEVRAAVVEALGDHPDATRIVDDGIRSMVESGVLRVTSPHG
ncbi:hypothetical protein [Knoellia sinensis]|uniref:hypothetical protein n=1 Tax=Knoellia sinensis TaxID=136100 RepID=UPI000AAE06F8|nr:hypothetical protein [Knoellia sinensis]